MIFFLQLDYFCPNIQVFFIKASELEESLKRTVIAKKSIGNVSRFKLVGSQLLCKLSYLV